MEIPLSCRNLNRITKPPPPMETLVNPALRGSYCACNVEESRRSRENLEGHPIAMTPQQAWSVCGLHKTTNKVPYGTRPPRDPF